MMKIKFVSSPRFLISSLGCTMVQNSLLSQGFHYGSKQPDVPGFGGSKTEQSFPFPDRLTKLLIKLTKHLYQISTPPLLSTPSTQYGPSGHTSRKNYQATYQQPTDQLTHLNYWRSGHTSRENYQATYQQPTDQPTHLHYAPSSHTSRKNYLATYQPSDPTSLWALGPYEQEKLPGDLITPFFK